MTVSSETNRVEYVGDGIVVAHPTTFNFAQDADLKVTLVDSAGTETVQTLSTHYTVTGAGSDTGGTVTMITAPASGEQLVIERDVVFTQGADYVPNDPFPAATHETALDKLTYLTQQLKTTVARTLQLASGETEIAVDMVLPVSTDGYLNKILGFDSAGKAKLYSQDELSAAATIITNKSVDQFTFGGATVVAALSTAPASETNTQVFHDGVYQAKTLYTLSGTTLTFAAAPGAGTVEVVYGAAIDIGTPTDGTVTEAKLAADAVSHTKLVPTFNKYKKGADLTTSDVVAGVLTLGIDGTYFDFTGTDIIAEITPVKVGHVFKLHFDAAATLTHNAIQLNLPGGENIVTAAGDEAEFIEYASGDVRCLNYQRASSIPLTYTEGVWTPTLSDGVNSDATQTIEVGTYTRIGRLVTIKGRLATSALGTISGALRITGLPFTAASLVNGDASVLVSEVDGLALGVRGDHVTGVIEPNKAYITLLVLETTIKTDDMVDTDWSASGEVVFSATYEV